MVITFWAARWVTFIDAHYGIYMCILLILCTYVNIMTVLEILR
jgi:hypothetical protein